MPYRAIRSSDFKQAGEGSYTANIEATLNKAEQAGYRLVGIEPAYSDDDVSIYILHREDPEVRRSGALN